MSHGGADDRRAPCIALLGGSFDPVHAGHLALADAAHAHGAAEVVWVPVAQSPFKLDGPRIEDADRLALLQAALLGRSGESIELREWGRSGPSYTIETLRELTAEQPSTRWAWLMGEDCLKSFVDWREAAEIAALAELWVGPRLEGSSSQLELHASRVAGRYPPCISSASHSRPSMLDRPRFGTAWLRVRTQDAGCCPRAYSTRSLRAACMAGLARLARKSAAWPCRSGCCVAKSSPESLVERTRSRRSTRRVHR